MKTARKYPLYKHVLALVDVFTVAVATFVAFALEERWATGGVSAFNGFIAEEMLFVLFTAGLSVFVFHYLGMYQIHVFITIVTHLLQIVKGLGVVVAGIALVLFFSQREFVDDGRLLILYFAVASLMLFIIIRVVVFRFAYLFLSRHKLIQRNVLIVGAGENGRNVAVNLFLHDYIGLRLVGFLDDEIRVGTPIFNAAAVVGPSSEMKQWVKKLHVQEILICLEKIEHATLMDLLEQAMPLNVIVKISSPLYEIVPLRRAIEHYGGVPVLAVFQSGMSARKEMFKRAFDIVMTSILLILSAPLFFMAAVAVKLTSPGPVFYRQERVGKNGTRFTMYKFRSMRIGGDDNERKKQIAAFIKTKRRGIPTGEISTKIVNEVRVTPVGKWLRKLSIDEMPQLINVLKGEMSLVGPRPCLPYEWEEYEEWHKRRLSVLPGLTGMWQVAGRSVVSFEDMVILDLHYIQNATLMLDFRMMLKTIPVMLFGIGAK